MDVNQIMDIARIMVKSGYFKGLSPEQIAVRIMRGQEVGIPPVASVMGMDDVRGRLGFYAHTMAAMVQRSGKYSYHIKETTDQRCVIEFFRGDELIGESEFTFEDAERAGLPQSNQQYQRYPKAMLYNRALSQGVKMYCPDVSLGAVYETSELEDFTEEVPESRPVPMMTESQVESEEHKSEPRASSKQLGLLRGLLKEYGVSDGSKTELINKIFPHGISKREASDAISLIKDGGRLIGTWANTYTTMLMIANNASRQDISLWMKEQFATNNPSALTHEQQVMLFDHIAGVDIVDTSEPGDIPEPEPTITPGDWAKLAQSICESTGVSLSDLTAWVIDRYAPESGYLDMTQLGVDAYNQLKAVDTVTIKSGVEELQGAK